ncbi:hypothetical protein B0J17DRAFT_661695 [Rhizoctonia solani]|nr:hypothetical protein B0J17DRAFT_661695 [Rhizoctonia solani]
MNSDPTELNSTELDQSNLGEVRAYLPPFKPLRGSHIIAEANLITRRLIESSITREILSIAKPVYRSLSVYPIVESSVTTLNSSDANTSIVTIRPSLASGLMYHRNQAKGWDPQSPVQDVCDYIEDYRSGTILDVIGSLGGLFALLQTAHLVLFGRPLLWGLIGTKTISPFGLLGGFSSSGFKQRLSDEYRSKSDDGTDTIRIVKFLRDFVIDFGPADWDLEKSPNTEMASLSAALVKHSNVSFYRFMYARPLSS